MVFWGDDIGQQSSRQSTGPCDNELLQASWEQLAPMAWRKARSCFGTRITYSPKVFIALTQLCRDRCGYCTFAKAPSRVASAYLEPEEVVSIARQGASAGVREALFTLGESPETRYPSAKRWLSAHGYASTVEYLVDAARLVTKETGLLVHSNAGALGSEDLAAIRQVAPSQGMMIETLADLACHRASPDKDPARRLATLEEAGALSIPFTTGILVGIGESKQDRLSALRAIVAAHERFGHIQEVIIQGFLPKPATSMQDWPACTREELGWTIAAARLLLPGDVHLQSPPNLVDDLDAILASGIDDWGGVSPVTLDYVNPERPWPAIEMLRAATERSGLVLAPRMTVYPHVVQRLSEFVDPSLHRYVLAASDAEGLARDDDWSPGTQVSPPLLVNRGKASWPRELTARMFAGPALARSRVGEVLQGVMEGQELGEDEIVALFGARGPQVRAVAEVADELRRSLVGDEVTFVYNRNINYTNVCTFRCRFCAFSKGPRSLNLRGEPYLLDEEEIVRRAVEAYTEGATEVCLQGGIHPSFDGNTYISITKAIKRAVPGIHVHGFTALEVTEGAKRLGEPLPQYLSRLKEAGLRTLPGTAAEILDDEVREVLCPDKISTEEWLECHRQAHLVGLRSNITIMFGSIESPRHWARHLSRTRALQVETGGFTEFVPLPFVHMGSPIFLQGKARRGPTFREALLMHAVGRIVYYPVVPHVQASWVKLGTRGVAQALMAGCDDMGGTLMDENISRAAGAEHGQRMTPRDFEELIAPLGRKLRQRTTLYEKLPQVSQARPA